MAPAEYFLLANWREPRGSRILPARPTTSSPPPSDAGDLPSSASTSSSSTPNTTPPSSRSSSPGPAPTKSWQNLRWERKGPPPPVLEWKVGRVVLLPEEVKLSPTTIRRDVPGKPWDHPAVITKIWEEKGVKLVKLRTCTSFTNCGGIEGKAEHQRHFYLQATPDQLRSDSDVFRKDTWVNCSPGHEMTIEYGVLCGWTGGRTWGAIQFSNAALASFNKNEPWSR